MPSHLRLASSQRPTRSTLQLTLSDLEAVTVSAAEQKVDIILFPEAYLGGYPRSCTFGAAVGSRSDAGREQYRQYLSNCVDLGDSASPAGEGENWLARKLPIDPKTGRRGDGTREFLEELARKTGIFIVTGLVERCGGSLFCAVLFVSPALGVVGKRRKLMPTGSERLVWSQGDASSLKAVVAEVRGIRCVMGAAICWENMMPLLRMSLYSQDVNLWFAPTADPRPTWSPLMQTVGMEGRCFVVSANQCMKRSELARWITETTGAASSDGKVNGVSKGTGKDEDEWMSRGGSCIVGPLGNFVVEPVWEDNDKLIVAEVDMEDCARGKIDFDAAGHYRMRQARFSVDGLDLIPPP